MSLVVGDCLTELPKLDAESIDLIATDPPYGISFMGKDWDRAVPSVEVWRESLRVLKPGAFAFVMSLPRLDVLSQMAMRLQEAGFRVDFTPLFWAYASGFPKAMNVSKAVDKKNGIKRKVVGMRPIAYPDSDVWGVPNRNVPLPKSELWGMVPNVTAGSRPVTLPESPEAKALDGSYAGFQPKPAVEVIIVAMKPLAERTYVEQALKDGKGVTWLDEGRIPFQSEDDFNNADGATQGNNFEPSSWNPRTEASQFNASDKGRFPANLLVSDDALNDGVERQPAGNHEESHRAKTGDDFLNGIGGFTDRNYYGGIDSFSRYFSLDAWWENKVKELPKSVRDTFPFLIEPKASKDERNEGLEGLPIRPIDFDSQTRTNKETADKYQAERKSKAQNHHPTVKPLAIMSYLITLGSRRGDVVLDPFAGSGTTIMAAKMLGRKGIGVEINPDYAKIAEARVQGLATIEEWVSS